MSHHVEIQVSPGCHQAGDGVLIDGKRIECTEVSLHAGVGQIPVVILHVAAKAVTVKGEVDVVSQVPE